MEIREITENKEHYRELLLLADEQWNMVERYLYRGTLYVLTEENELRALCVVTDEGCGTLEIKNLAVSPAFQHRGYGRALIDFVRSHYAGQYQTLQVGTGESPLTIPFYEACGFTRSHRIKNFFTDNYDHPIVECGIVLTDMVYLKMPL